MKQMNCGGTVQKPEKKTSVDESTPKADHSKKLKNVQSGMFELYVAVEY